MKKLIFTLILSYCFFATAITQVGISFGYVKADAPEYSEMLRNDELLTSFEDFEENTFQVSIDYWFRLKNVRVEFLPEISYHKMDASYEGVSGTDFGTSGDFNINYFQLNFNTQIYPFDFKGDCDCPTFSKDGDVLKKGFFIRVAPGMSVISNTESFDWNTIGGIISGQSSDNYLGLNLRAGIGLDIGVSDFFTVTPILQYTYTRADDFSNYFDTEPGAPAGISSFTQFYAGIRLGFRFDELNKYGYR